jgi:hypothetical protein
MGVLETLIVGIIAIVVGAVGTIFGYGIWRLALPIIGGFYGYVVGSTLVAPEQWFLALLLGLAVAIILAMFAYFLWSFLAVLYGVILGAAVGVMLSVALNANEGGIVMWTFLIIGAVVGAVLAAVLKDRIVMLVTAFSGAGAILYGVGLLLPSFLSFLTDTSSSVIAFIIWMVIGLVGFLIQTALFTNRLTGAYALETR